MLNIHFLISINSPFVWVAFLHLKVSHWRHTSIMVFTCLGIAFADVVGTWRGLAVSVPHWPALKLFKITSKLSLILFFPQTQSSLGNFSLLVLGVWGGYTEPLLYFCLVMVWGEYTGPFLCFYLAHIVKYFFHERYSDLPDAGLQGL